MSSSDVSGALERLHLEEVKSLLCTDWAGLSLHCTDVDPLASCYARWWPTPGSGRHGRWAVLGSARIAPALVMTLRRAGAILEGSPTAQQRFPAAVLAIANPLERWLSALQFRGDAVLERQPMFNGAGLGDSKVIWDLADHSALLCVELAIADALVGDGHSPGQAHLIGFDADMHRFEPLLGRFEGATRQ